MAPTTTLSTIAGTNLPLLELCPIQPAQAAMVHDWLEDERSRIWLDLGSGRQQLPARQLYLMLTGQRCHARLFRLPGSEQFLGLVCLTDCSNEMGSAEVWGARGFYGPTPPHVSVAAFLSILANGFVDLGREVIGSWVVEGNQFSIAMHERLGFHQTGRQRARHRVNGRLHDRLLFDMTREEFASRFPQAAAESGRSIAGATQVEFA